MRFKPDPDIFKTGTTFEFDRISGRLDELAYLNAGISISLEDTRCVSFVCVYYVSHRRIGAIPTAS